MTHYDESEVCGYNTNSYQSSKEYLLAHTVVLTVVCIILLLLLIPAFIIAMLKRNSFPMKYRSFPLSAIIFTCPSIDCFLTLLDVNGIIPCEIHRFFSVFCLIVAFSTVELYIFRVYYQTRIMQGSVDDLVRFFSKSRLFNSNRFYFFFLFLHIFIFFGSWLILCLNPSTTYPQLTHLCTYPCGDGPPWNLYWVVVYLIECIIILVWVSISTYRSLRGINDTLLFKRDLKLLAIVCGTVIVIYVVVGAFNEPLGEDLLRVMSFSLNWFCISGLTSVSVFFIDQDRQPITPADLTTTLTKILLSDIKKDFITFLKSEWSLENILFYDEIERFKIKPEVEHAHKIYDTFIKNGSTRQINLDGEVVSEIQEGLELQAIDKELFQKAQDIVIQYMAEDSLPRFIKFKGWKESSSQSRSGGEVQSDIALVSTHKNSTGSGNSNDESS